MLSRRHIVVPCFLQHGLDRHHGILRHRLLPSLELGQIVQSFVPLISVRRAFQRPQRGTPENRRRLNSKVAVNEFDYTQEDGTQYKLHHKITERCVPQNEQLTKTPDENMVWMYRLQ